MKKKNYSKPTSRVIAFTHPTALCDASTNDLNFDAGSMYNGTNTDNEDFFD